MTSQAVTRLFTKARRSPFLREFLLFAASTVLLQGSRFAVNLFAAERLGPERFGFWYVLNLALAYGGLAHLGVINAMNRDVPVFRGKGNAERVRLIQGVSAGVLLVSTAVAGLVMVVSLAFLEHVPRAPLAALIALFIVTQPYLLLQVYLKSDGQFGRLSFQQLLFALLFPLSVVPLTIGYGLSGFISGQALVTLLISLFVLRTWTFHLRPVFNVQETLRLVRVGLPIMLVGLMYTLLTTADRWVITAFLDVQRLGYYSLAIMVLGVLSLIPMVVAQQMYPRMAEAWGRTSDAGDVLRWALRQTGMALAFTAPLVLVLYFAAPPLIEAFLPAYTEGVAPVKIILFGPLFLALSGGFANLLNTLDKQVYYLAVQAAALLVNVGLNVMFVRAGMGISGIALGTTLTYALYGLALVAVSLWLVRSPDRAEA